MALYKIESVLYKCRTYLASSKYIILKELFTIDAMESMSDEDLDSLSNIDLNSLQIFLINIILPLPSYAVSSIEYLRKRCQKYSIQYTKNTNVLHIKYSKRIQATYFSASKYFYITGFRTLGEIELITKFFKIVFQWL